MPRSTIDSTMPSSNSTRASPVPNMTSSPSTKSSSDLNRLSSTTTIDPSPLSQALTILNHPRSKSDRSPTSYAFNSNITSSTTINAISPNSYPPYNPPIWLAPPWTQPILNTNSSAFYQSHPISIIIQPIEIIGSSTPSSLTLRILNPPNPIRSIKS